jgi:hypothetical protein
MKDVIVNDTHILASTRQEMDKLASQYECYAPSTRKGDYYRRMMGGQQYYMLVRNRENSNPNQGEHNG